MASAMSLDNAITHCIREASEQYSLNASDISIRGRRVQWRSTCGGPIGTIVFRVPVRRFEESIEDGVSDVSTLISFASLTLREENVELAENIRSAVHDYRAPHYFQLINDARRVLVYIGIPSDGTYTTVGVEYTNNDVTGEYVWTIPSIDVLYRSIRGQDDDTDDPPVLTELVHNTSTYDSIGLCATQSIGLPVRCVSDSIRVHSTYPDTLVAGPAELSEESTTKETIIHAPDLST